MTNSLIEIHEQLKETENKRVFNSLLERLAFNVAWDSFFNEIELRATAELV